MVGYVVFSNETNIYYNMAYEYCCIETVRQNNILILYFWKNDKSIVVGRHQDIISECNLDIVQKYGIHLARRNTGGGAVYHDLGNINYTIILPINFNNLPPPMYVVHEALNDIGVIVEISGRNDITVGGKKISGNAFFVDKAINMCHGTMLFNTDLDIMDEVLTPNMEKLKKNNVESVHARVLNLREAYPNLSEELFCNALKERFIDLYGIKKRYTNIDISKHLLHIYISQLSSKQWIYGKVHTPKIKMTEKFEWGIVTIAFELQRGKLANCRLYTDSIDVCWVRRIEFLLNKAVCRRIFSNVGIYISKFLPKNYFKLAEDIGGLFETVWRQYAYSC